MVKQEVKHVDERIEVSYGMFRDVGGCRSPAGERKPDRCNRPDLRLLAGDPNRVAQKLKWYRVRVLVNVISMGVAVGALYFNFREMLAAPSLTTFITIVVCLGWTGITFWNVLNEIDRYLMP